MTDQSSGVVNRTAGANSDQSSGPGPNRPSHQRVIAWRLPEIHRELPGSQGNQRGTLTATADRPAAGHRLPEVLLVGQSFQPRPQLTVPVPLELINQCVVPVDCRMSARPALRPRGPARRDGFDGSREYQRRDKLTVGERATRSVGAVPTRGRGRERLTGGPKRYAAGRGARRAGGDPTAVSGPHSSRRPTQAGPHPPCQSADSPAPAPPRTPRSIRTQNRQSARRPTQY